MEKTRTLYGFGDSLVRGHWLGIGMLDALAAKYGMEYTNYAKNGACMIAKPSSSEESGKGVLDVAAQIRMASAAVPDVICFDGLINDAYPDTIKRLGKLTETYDGGYDVSCFYGAFEQVCYLLRKKYRDSRMFYICVHKMPTRDMNVQETLQKAAREVCEKWSIPYADVFRCGQINTCVDEMRRAYSYNGPECLTDGNGTHLNAEGYEMWYLPVIEGAIKAFGEL